MKFLLEGILFCSVFSVIGYLAYLDNTDLNPPTISSYKGLALVMIIILFIGLLFINAITLPKHNSKSMESKK